MIWCGQIHFEGHWGGVGPKIATFVGPEMTTSEASASWAQKCRQILVNDVWTLREQKSPLMNKKGLTCQPCL
jgi:hypothetical protein